MPVTTLTAQPFVPSSGLTGSERGLYRGKNMKLRGNSLTAFYEAYAGSKSLSEPLPTTAITGTISFSPSSNTVTGTSTVFQTELHLGQLLQASNGEPLSVKSIESQTSFTCWRLPSSTGTTLTAILLPVIYSLNTNRGAQTRGNSILTDRGNIITVGDGVVYKNGQPLPGVGMTAKRRAQIALYDSATNEYDVVDLGFDDVPIVTNTDITVVASGGTKNMSLGYYSFKVGYYADKTSGQGNPTDTLLSGGLTGYQLTVANSTFNFNFTADVSNRPAKATGYVIYGTAFAGSSDISALNSVQGAWFEAKLIPFTSLTSNQIAIEYVDSELGANVSFNNDTAPDAEFIVSLGNYPFLISTNGQGVDVAGREPETSPGPFIAPCKATNLDAFPASFRVPTAFGETIIGAIPVPAAGRIFVTTPNTLQAVTPTGIESAPFDCRPFWSRGFATPYSVIFVDDTLYGFSGNRIFRSIATGNEADAAYDFAAAVEQQLMQLNAGYVYLVHDPMNEEICLVATAVRQNDDGFWETDIYPYSLVQRVWQPIITLSSTSQDMIVSGVATIAGRMEFLCGGRVGTGSSVVVSGAGTAVANGTYLESGIFHGKPYYTLVGHSPDAPNWSVNWVPNLWQIFTDDAMYTSTDNVDYPWQVTTWIQDVGSLPIPVVTQAQTQTDTWQYDEFSGESVPWYLAWTLIDSGIELVGKIIRKLRARAKVTDAKIQVYGALPSSDVDITDLETGANPLFETALADSSIVKSYGIVKTNVKNLSMWTARIEGSSVWDGVSEKDQVHEIAVMYDISGQER